MKKIIPPKESEKYIASLGSYLGREKICYQTREAHCRAHFLINPTGDVVIPIMENGETSDLCLGNLLVDDVNSIIDRWKKKVDVKNYRCNWCAVKIQITH